MPETALVSSAPALTDVLLDRRTFLAAVGMGTLILAVGADRLGAAMSDSTLLERVRVGAYAAREPWPDVSPHYALETALGVKLPIMSWFQSWANGWLTRQAATAAASGHDLQIALAPALDNGNAVPFTDILSGRWNTRLDRYFAGAATYPHQVTIRMAHEMNLRQHPWSIANGAACTNDLNIWLDTWRYVVDRQRTVGGDNIHWQWCVNSMDIGPVRAESYWPGADYVDVLSIDVYNGYGPYTAPLKIIKPMYERITALHPTAPVWIAEVGCRAARPGESWNKSGWYEDLFAITDLPRLEAILFFNMDKEYDWRVTTDDVVGVLGGELRSAQTAQAR